MTLPTDMTRIEISAPGGPDVLRPVQAPLPVPGPGEVLVRVRAAGVNRPDVAQRQGVYPPPPGASPIPGLEIAGEIAALGPDVTRWALGDAVCALTAGGGYAEYSSVDQGSVLPVPSGLSMIEAAALPETFFTVWHNVFERGRLAPGETLLVHGGSSGIGTTAIMMARALGARVLATAGSATKCAACEELGASAINYRETDFVEEVARLTEGAGADVILDMVGGDYLDRNIAALAEEGRIVQIAFLEGAAPRLTLFPLLRKRGWITGSLLRPRSLSDKAAMARAIEERVWPHVAEGRIRPVIDSTYPLAAAADAHARMEGGEHVGKIVLEVA
ncbi:MAG: NAD(P)H-quinone oxidoreductase [Rhodobacteraceae bacterium]|nr:NAD(P)H-quinone oxidoreductase [Paracoccaceae bacterium]